MPSKQGDYAAVRKSIAKAMNQPGYDNYDEDVRHTAGPVLVRLAWHASGTYDKETDTGGSDGAGMRYEAEGGDPANAGLQHARVFLEPVKAEHPWISYADLWTLGGVVAIKEMGGPEIPWKPGRTDFTDDSKCPPRGRLPDGAQAADHLRFIFYRMGFNDKDIVTLSGAHNLGRCHADRSGFEGPWVNNPTRFSNQYFVLLKKNDWKPKDWGKREGMPFQYSSASALGGEDLMMLPTDYALLQDEAFRPWVEKYAEDKELFFADFSKVFARLVELGVHRDEHGEYVAADKKSDKPGAPDKVGRDGEAQGVREGNELRAKL